MTRYMYDAIWANVNALEAEKPSLYALYLTGTANIRWQSVPSFLASATPVRIDQGGLTSPQYEANVFDVEPGAWSMTNAIAATEKCTAPRPTIYCDRSDYATVPASYKGDLWIAAPGLTDSAAEALAAKDKRIVAVQNLWADTYDRSVVTDPVWPAKPVATPVTAIVTWYGDTGLTTRVGVFSRALWDVIKWDESPGVLPPGKPSAVIPVTVLWQGVNGPVLRKTTFTRPQWDTITWS